MELWLADRGRVLGRMGGHADGYGALLPLCESESVRSEGLAQGAASVQRKCLQHLQKEQSS